jgi:hypothetical protein
MFLLRALLRDVSVNYRWSVTLSMQLYVPRNP